MVKKTLLKASILCVMCILLCNCTEIKVSHKEMTGVWVASDGAELSLNKDGTFELKGFNPRYWRLIWVNEKNLHFTVYAKGKWEIANEDNDTSPTIKIHCSEAVNYPTPGYEFTELPESIKNVFNLNILGTNSPFYNKPPWVIGIREFIDEGEFYKFQKKEEEK